MTLLNAYILKKFFRPFWASFAALCVLVFVSEVFERLDRFMAAGVSFWHVAGYLVTSMPYQAMQILPVACMLATLFVAGNLARTREYIAALAGGIPPEKFFGGLVTAGLVIAGLGIVANETIVPKATEYSEQVFREKIRRLGSWHQSSYTDLLVTGRDGRVWNIKNFDESSGKTTRLVVDTTTGDKILSQIDASSAAWTSNGWFFYNGVLRTFSPDTFLVSTVEPFGEKTFSFREKPYDLVTQEPQPDQMNYKTLKAHIKRLASLGIEVRKLEVELYSKVAFPVSCFIVVMLAVPLAMRGRGNRAMGIASAAATILIYNGFQQVGKVMAQHLITPWLGAWLGNIIFLLLSLALWKQMRKTA